MTARPQKSEEAGFTIQELLVVLIVGSLLVTFCLSLFLFTGKLFSSWQRHAGARRALDGVLQVISLDVQRASSVTVIPDSLCFVDRGAGRIVEYRLTPDSVLRNGVSMATSEGKQLSGRIVSGRGQGSDESSGWYHLELIGTIGGSRYVAACDLAAPKSSLASFIAARGKVRQ